MVSIFWFRQDLRLADNPALCLAAANTVIPVYIEDTSNAENYSLGAASKWWLHHSLAALNADLEHKLLLLSGDPLEIIPRLCQEHAVEAVYWNRSYEPWQIKRDKKLKQILLQSDIKCQSENSALLWEPWQIVKADKTPYKVFTPFYKKGCLGSQPPRIPLAKPEQLSIKKVTGLTLAELDLLPKINWDHGFSKHWQVGESSAWQQLERFIATGLSQYKNGRNLPAKLNTSKLSPHLHFGEISPQQIWHEINLLAPDHNTEHFCSELGWREFSYNLLYFNPELPTKNLQSKFDNFPWQDSSANLKAWQQGKTGIPMVDAGMRELWQTGFMHNRVRMIVGSFLVKNLRLHWQHGERWFWDTLVDADLANNSASWQWIAGCGADAAPYFRIFNPITQGEKFDPNGDYVRQYLPELAKLPNKYLFSPWLAPAEVLASAGVELGNDYPWPIVDLKQSRAAALADFSQLKSGNGREDEGFND